MPAGRRDLERALGGLLSLDLLEVAAADLAFNHAGFGGGQLLRAFEVIEQARQVGRGADRYLARPARF